MQYCTEKSWYVLRVRSQAERLVHVGLHHKQFEVLNPTYKALSIRKDRRKVLTRPIFNGYMFIRALLDPERHLEILKTPGVLEILKSKSGPTPVPDNQIARCARPSDSWQDDLCVLDRELVGRSLVRWRSFGRVRRRDRHQEPKDECWQQTHHDSSPSM